MSRLINTNSKSWGETLGFQSAPDLVTQRTKRAPVSVRGRLVWFALGLAVGLAPVLIG